MLIKNETKLISCFSIVLFFMFVVSGCTPLIDNNKIFLNGKWHVVLDSIEGGSANWESGRIRGVEIELPGTLDDAGLGTKSLLEPEMNNYVLSHLARKHQYIGKAWYQREVEIPEEWEGKTIELNLERIIWESQVYVNGEKIGDHQESLVAPHRYDLTEVLTPGKHILTVMVDNSNRYPKINVEGSKYEDPTSKDLSHGYTNHTQIKWNGVIGEMSLTARNKDSVADIQVFSDVNNAQISVKIKGVTGQVDDIAYRILDNEEREILAGSEKLTVSDNDGSNAFKISTQNKLKLWGEFNPELYTLQLNLKQENGKTYDTQQVRFGFREVANKNAVLTLNNERIFLRGNLECAIFPLTGYPLMKKEDWQNLISTAKSYGLNHLRFHSWCPPKAAFDAADEAGFYFQVELPHWSLKVGEDKKTTQFLMEEADRIMSEYGNHPSFILFSLGNELQGDSTLLNNMVKTLKQKDNRHLYMTTTFSFQKGMGTKPLAQDEYFVTQYTDKGWIRGQGIFNTQPPHFNKDYSAAIEHIDVPIISHEIGQYSVFPAINEIEKYTGVLQPLNFIAIKNDLKKKGLIELAPDFTLASGKLATLLYKEEIERALKTEGFDGFQLLQLQDFPGQGTALVGILDAFWESKGIISSEKFREFNSELVPLLEFEKAIYEDGETFEAVLEVANFHKERENATLSWKINDEEGITLATGEFKELNLVIGNNKNIGKIKFPIATNKGKRLSISVSLKDTPYRNSWSIWVYPKNLLTSSDNVLITSDFEEAENALLKGKSVLLNPPLESINGREGRFVPVFWSPVHFPDQPGTMGILCDPKHDAFAYFPTDYHSDWQWWDLAIKSKSIIFDSLEVQPIVRVIDNFVTNHHLANVFEVKVGTGKLIFSSIDLASDLDNRPVARQFLHSLLKYMESDHFNPDKIVEFRNLEKQLHSNNKR